MTKCDICKKENPKLIVCGRCFAKTLATKEEEEIRKRLEALGYLK